TCALPICMPQIGGKDLQAIATEEPLSPFRASGREEGEAPIVREANQAIRVPEVRRHVQVLQEPESQLVFVGDARLVGASAGVAPAGEGVLGRQAELAETGMSIGYDDPVVIVSGALVHQKDAAGAGCGELMAVLAHKVV